MPASASTELDVRDLIPALRHSTIFENLTYLVPGRSLLLVNDHDPRPLRHQLDDRYPGQFSWIYREQGPLVWRVEITRILPEVA